MSIPDDEERGLRLLIQELNAKEKLDRKQDVDKHWAEASLSLRTALMKLLAAQSDVIHNGGHVNGYHMAIGFARSLGDVLYDLSAATTISVEDLTKIIATRLNVMHNELQTGKAVIIYGQFKRVDRPSTVN